MASRYHAAKWAVGGFSDALAMEGEAARAREAEKWRHLTGSTVFEDAELIPELLNR
jgi:hypothetical protein